jgi:hypothetical protein
MRPLFKRFFAHACEDAYVRSETNQNAYRLLADRNSLGRLSHPPFRQYREYLVLTKIWIDC